MKNILNRIILFALGWTTVIGCGKQDVKSQTEILEPAKFVKELENDKNSYLLDVRRADEYSQGHLPNAILLDVTDSVVFLNGIKKIDKEKNVYIYCRSGRRSQKAAKILVEQGFKVKDLKGGYIEWVKFVKNKQ